MGNKVHVGTAALAGLRPAIGLERLRCYPQDAGEHEVRPGNWVRGPSCPLPPDVSVVGAPIYSTTGFTCDTCLGLVLDTRKALLLGYVVHDSIRLAVRASSPAL